MARKGSGRSAKKGSRTARRSVKARAGRRSSKHLRRSRKATRRVAHRGGNGNSAFHHAIAMVGDSTTQLKNSLASAYN